MANGHAAAVDARIVIDESVLEGKPKMPHLVLTPYPTRYVAPWKLTDGTEVLLRPVKPEDEPMIGELLATVSAKTLHDRFLGQVVDFDHARLVRFTNIDYDREIAIIAELTRGKKKRIIGVGRLTGEADRGIGEFAVLVHDEFQGRGLGFKLIDLVIGIARDKGFEQIKGYISSENRRMLTLVHELGFTDTCTEEGVCSVQLRLV